MPLEIKELVITLTIEDNSSKIISNDLIELKHKINYLEKKIVNLTTTIANIYER